MTPQRILVTGASSGIGRATALHLARAGHHVFATARRLDKLEALAAEAKGTRLEVLSLDVTRADSIAAAHAEILRRTDGHGIDALVNNAGYGAVGPLEEFSDADLRAQFETNVFGLMAVTRAFLPAMRARRHGRIVNISSVGGRLTFPLFGAYNGTKYAVESMSDALRMELRPFNVRVSIVEPGAIRTEFSDVSMASVKLAPDSAYAPVLKSAPATAARFAERGVGPEHVATAIEHAIVSANPSARYVRPWRTYVLLWMKWLLPTSVFDGMQARMMGLDVLNA